MQITALNIDPKGVCTPDGLKRKVTLDATLSGPGAGQYVWTFGDGTSKSVPGSAGPLVTHDFAPGTWTVKLQVKSPGCTDVDLSKPITVPVCCPLVAGIDVVQAPCETGSPTVPTTVSARTTGTTPTSYVWNFGDGTVVTTSGPQAPLHQYAPGPHTVSVAVTAPGCPSASSSVTVSIDACSGPVKPTKTQIDLCSGLLWAAIITSIVGAFLVFTGCIVGKWVPWVGVIVEAIGMTLLGISVVLFGLWWILCRFITPCEVILAVLNFVKTLIYVVAVILAVSAVINIFVSFDWGCFLRALIFFGYWGVVLALLVDLAMFRRCLVVNTNGSSGASLSGDETTRLPKTPVTAGSTGSSGLGDVVRNVTSAMGIQPCAACHERAERLNRAFPLGPGADRSP